MEKRKINVNHAHAYKDESSDKLHQFLEELKEKEMDNIDIYIPDKVKEDIEQSLKDSNGDVYVDDNIKNKISEMQDRIDTIETPGTDEAKEQYSNFKEQTITDIDNAYKFVKPMFDNMRLEKAKENLEKATNTYNKIAKQLSQDERSDVALDGTQMSTYYDDMTKNDIFTTSTPYFNMHEDSSETRPSGDRVDHPDYYNLSDGPSLYVDGKKVMIECIDVIRDMPTWKGNVFKYLWRCGSKSEEGLTKQQKELEDMEKALWYLQDKINQLKSNK